MSNNIIRFDWAMKKMLRNKANFDILEGFLSELLNDTIQIQKILEGESNQEREDDKFNRVDLLVENAQKELIIIEIQNSKAYDYFHRMLYGTSKAISEHIVQGKPYSTVRKVISVTIAYFDLGQGEDYVYHGTNIFRGIHKDDVLSLADKQKELYNKQQIYEIFPEYWIIKVGRFSNTISDKLDEWIYFFKNSEIKATFSAKGLKEAGEKLKAMTLPESEYQEYQRYLRRLMDIASEQETFRIDTEDLIIKERAEEREKTIQSAVQSLYQNGISIPIIAQSLQIPEEKTHQYLSHP